MRKLALVTAGFAGAVGIIIYLMDGVCWLLAFAGAVLTALGLFLGRKARPLRLILLGIFLGALWCSGYTQFVLAPARALCDRPCSFTATAVSFSEQTNYGARVEAKLHLKGKDVRAQLYLPKDCPAVLPGDLLEGEGEFAFTAAEGDGDFYHPAGGVFLTGSAEKTLSVTPQERIGLQNTMTRLSYRVKENLNHVFPASSAGYFTALVTGDRSGLSYGFLNDMSLCGLYHSVSLSGMHVSLLMLVILTLFGGRRSWALALGVPMLVLFLMLSGMRPSTVRAVVMQTVLMLGAVSRREYDPPTSLCAALLVLLLENPWCLAQWGLQLSFASTAGIIFLCPGMMRRFDRFEIRGKLLRKVLAAVWGAVSVTLSATLASLPLMIAYFGVSSIIAPLANLLALWAVLWSFVGGLALAVLSFICMPLAALLGNVLHVLFVYLLLVLRLLSRLPLAAVYDTQPYLIGWSVLWYFTLVMVMRVPVRLWLAVVCAAGSFLLCFCLDGAARAENAFTVLDVGQGQSLVCTYGEETYLIDCGGKAAQSGETAARYLLGSGVTELDGVILTHFDADHCNGAAQLMDRVNVGTLYYPARAEDTAVRSQVLASAAACGVKCVAVDAVTELGILTLYPSTFGEKDNDTGLCILASAAECDILVTGDLSVEAENVLLSAYDFPDLEVFVAGHHGSSGSTGVPLLDALKPEIVLISAGENSYGHPSEKTLARLADFGAAAYTTKDNGNLTVRW